MSKMIMQLRILYTVCVLNLIENLNIEDTSHQNVGNITHTRFQRPKTVSVWCPYSACIYGR